MSSEPAQGARTVFLHWMKATFYGWMLGFVLVVLLALASDAVGGMAQFMVGVGMGAGVGYVQGRRIGRWIDRPGRWFWASTLGMGAPFVVWDIGSAVGVDILSSLPACVVIGGVLVAILQWRLLRPVSGRAIWWLPACAAGWSLPALVIAMKDVQAVPEQVSAVLGLVGMFGGGLLLGAVTGPALLGVVRAMEPAGGRKLPGSPDA